MTAAFGATAYVSYARADEQRVQVVSRLHQDFAGEWVHLRVDVNEVQPRESFEDFIGKIGGADCVVVMFSDSYMRSFYCMLELTRIMQQGDAIERIYPVFVEEGFRLDGARQQWKSYWQEKSDYWHEQVHDEPGEITDAYGSVTECREILANLDAVFDTFARRLAGKVPDRNAEIIAWVKQTYFQRIQGNPVFKKSIQYLLRGCHEKTRNTLRLVVDEYLAENQGNHEGSLDKSEELIPYLVQLPIPALLEIFNTAQEFVDEQDWDNALVKRCLEDLSQLLRYLVPLLFQPEAVKHLQARREDMSRGIVVIPCASEVSAEILMAGLDQRPAEFDYCELASGQMVLRPGKYCLPLPPESGDAGVGGSLKDTALDLAQRMGLDTIDEKLFHKFVNEPGVDVRQRHLLVKDELEFLKDDGEPGYYWILATGGGSSIHHWSALADVLSKRYPEILLLSLDTLRLREERKFFRMLHKVVPRHSTIKG